jgi:hypothetical protein
MIWLMEMEGILMQMGLSMMESGSKISKKVLVEKCGLMEHDMKATSPMEWRKVKGSWCSLKDQSTGESSTTMRSMEWVCTHGMMERYMRVSGKTIKWMDKVIWHGVMGESTRACSKMIRDMDKDSSGGEMVGYIEASGKMENNMEWATSKHQRQLMNRRESGTMEWD